MKNPYSLKNILLSEGTTKNEVIKKAIQGILNEDVRFNFQKGGGGGKRFIPTNGIVPSRLFTALPNHFKMLGDQLLISPEAVIALTSVERGRGGAVNYKELYGKLRGYFDIKKADSSSEFGPAQTSSFLSQFKQGLKGRLESVVVGGKEFKVWNGEGSKDEKGDFIFPLSQFKADSLQEDEGNLRSQLHTLVGNEMRLGKRANMTGASHHEEEHKKAEKAVEDFLRKNPSMEEYRDKVEDNFTKLLYKSESIEEINLAKAVGVGAMALGSMMAPKAQAQQAPNTSQQKTWQQMTQGEKGAKKQELIKKGGIEAFNAYKDSIGTDARGRADAVLNKAAADAGMSPEKYIKFLQKRNSGEDAGLSGLEGEKDVKNRRKSPCKGGNGCYK